MVAPPGGQLNDKGARLALFGPLGKLSWRIPIDRRGIRAYEAAMIRFFDMTDHARLPWRFTALNRSVLARLR